MNASRVRTFGELIDSGVLLVSDGYRAKNEELGGAGPIFLRAAHVTDSHIDLAGVERFWPELEGKVSSKLSRAGDVVVTTKGNSTGRVAFVAASLPPFVYSPHLSFWRSLDENVVCPGFLRYWSRGREFREQLKGLASSTDMAPYLSLADQKRLRISLPEITRQRSIAEVLGALDDKIDLNRRMNETLEAIARAVFKSWFVDFNPVREGEGGAVEGLLSGEIPASWKRVPLDSIANFLNGLAMQKYPVLEEGDTLPVIKIAELRRGDTAGSDLADSGIPGDYVIEDGDVLFSWSGTLEVVVWAGGRGALNQHVFKVTSSRYPKWFYLYWIKAHLSEFRAIAAGKATTMGHIQRRHLSEAFVVVPSPDVLEQIDRLMGPLLDRQLSNNIESRTLATLRDTLLPKLLSGEIRVQQAEEMVGEAV